MEREACICDHGFERSDLCAEIIIIIIIMIILLFIQINHQAATPKHFYRAHCRDTTRH